MVDYLPGAAVVVKVLIAYLDAACKIKFLNLLKSKTRMRLVKKNPAQHQWQALFGK